MQNLIYEQNTVLVDEFSPMITEPFIPVDVIENPVQINTEGRTYVDLTIEGGTVIKLGSVNSLDNNSIRLAIFADNSKDSFKMGLVTPNKEKLYFESIDGSLFNSYDKLELGEMLGVRRNNY